MTPRPRLAWAALAFGLAALGSAWNPAAAPFGLAVGLASALLSISALRAGGRRVASSLGLAISLAAVVTAVAVLALTAGVGRQPSETSLVAQPPAGEVGRRLDEAAARSRQARERAKGELEQLEPARPKPPSH